MVDAQNKIQYQYQAEAHVATVERRVDVRSIATASILFVRLLTVFPFVDLHQNIEVFLHCFSSIPVYHNVMPQDLAAYGTEVSHKITTNAMLAMNLRTRTLNF